MSASDINNNLKNFLKGKVATQDINIYTLGKEIGFNHSINSFINGKREQKTLSSQIVVALADHFQVSLDEMVGRIKPINSIINSEKVENNNTDLQKS